MRKTIRHELDLQNLPPLTPAQQAQLQALTQQPDEAIDTSDIAPLDDAMWRHAVRNPFYKPTKTSTTVRVDADVLAWLKSQGKGYQTRINAILREAMLRAIEHKT
ncbi:MAG: BrnA antitoxin family protein [Proteobacteria bacterium]|nr:BrnA antitoxin family protein [Pseudomonadota bacterium]